MALFNHNLSFRPLRGGIALLNPIVNKIGTLGIVVASPNQDRWLVSCYHVLGRIDLTPFVDGEPIFQSGDDQVPAVAFNSVQRSDAGLDCAAARLPPNILGSKEILGLPPIAGLVNPGIGMRVIKSGCVTGITEGVITAVQGNDITISLAPGFPQTYEISAEGDSGSLWITRDGAQAVALHRAGSNSGAHEARATNFAAVLQSLNLQFIP